MTRPQILLLNGPNLNLLGEREPQIYGYDTLADIEGALTQQAEAMGYGVICQQSNHEGVLIDAIQQARGTTCGLIINPGAYGHTSIALKDAVSSYHEPVVEVHLSNIHKREAYRQHTYTSHVVQGVICGLGADGYRLAMDWLLRKLAS
jgi:3-dehydroquinate dehydratase II